MKNIMMILMGAAFALTWAVDAQAQNSPKTKVDTSKAWKRTYEPNPVKDPTMTGPLPGDSAGVYNNRIYENGIRNAEYQNRGAEDRRNINTADPNAIPNRQVPKEETKPVAPGK